MCVFGGFAIIAGAVLTFTKEDPGYFGRVFAVTQALSSLLFFNMSYDITSAFASLLSVVDVGSSFAFFPNWFSLMLSDSLASYIAPLNFLIYGFDGYLFNDLGGLIFAFGYFLVFHILGWITSKVLPTLSRLFYIFGLETFFRFITYGSYQICSLLMLGVTQVNFTYTIFLVAWILSILFLVMYVGLLCYMGYVEYQIHRIKEVPKKVEYR
jgi:hypothetical protein